MAIKDISMIVLDLDGTVLHSDKTISAYTIKILEKCRQDGVKIVVATARSEMAAKYYIEVINPDVVISNGGSLVRHGEHTIYKCLLSAEISDKITAELMSKEEFISISLETETGYYVTWDEAFSPDYSHAIKYDFAKPLSQDTYKITVEFSDEAIIKQVVSKYSKCDMIAFSDENWYRLANKDSGKMNAIKATAAYFNINLSRIASFGDDYNDVEMIKNCGYGVSMKNAVEEVKAVAKYICDANDNDGVAKWIAQRML